MKAKFLVCMILSCLFGKIYGLARGVCSEVIFLNKSSSECTIDLTKTSDLKITEYNLMPTSNSRDRWIDPFELCDDRSVTYDQFLLRPNEYKIFYCAPLKTTETTDNYVVIKKNEVAIGTAYWGIENPWLSNWIFDKKDRSLIFSVNTEQRLVLYRKKKIWHGYNVIKILDFNPNIRYMNPWNEAYRLDLCNNNEWNLTIPEGDLDQRPIYLEPYQNVLDILRGAKQVIFPAGTRRHMRKLKRELVQVGQLVD